MQARCHLHHVRIPTTLLCAALLTGCVWRTSSDADEATPSAQAPAEGEPELPEGVTRTITKNPDGTEHVDINVDLTEYDPDAQPQVETLPRPFTAEQLQQGLAEGTRLSFRIEGEQAGEGIVHWTITATSEREVTIAYAMDEGSTMAPPPDSETYPWFQLVDHASYPSAFSTRAREAVTTPVGTFDAWVYEVRPPDADPPVVERLWFADTLPGPPVKHEVRSEGRLVHKMALVAHSQAAPADTPAR